MFKLDLFPAREGDALMLTWGADDAPKRLLIDGGRAGCWNDMKREFIKLPREEQVFELLVVSHIDRDHIAGVLKMLGDTRRPIQFKEVWFNAYHHLLEGNWQTFGVEQGEKLSDMLEHSLEYWNTSFGHNAVVVDADGDLPKVEIEGLRLTLLSPTWKKLENLRRTWSKWLKEEGLERGPLTEKPDADFRIIPEGIEAFGSSPDVEELAEWPFTEDDSEPNGSSIAFIAEYEGKRALMAADAHPSVLVQSLSRLPATERKFDVAKLSHHGSKKNFSRELFDAMDCDRFVISTNGSYFDHPDQQTMAQLVKWHDGQPTVYFNYRSEEAVLWDKAALKTRYGYDCVYPADMEGRLTIDI